MAHNYIDIHKKYMITKYNGLAFDASSLQGGELRSKIIW